MGAGTFSAGVGDTVRGPCPLRGRAEGIAAPVDHSAICLVTQHPTQYASALSHYDVLFRPPAMRECCITSHERYAEERCSSERVRRFASSGDDRG